MTPDCSAHRVQRIRPAIATAVAAVTLSVILSLIAQVHGRAHGASSWQIGLLDQHGGAMQAVAAAGSSLYVGLGTRLTSFDVTDPATPVMIGKSALLTGTIRAIAVRGAYVFVGTADLPQPASAMDGAAGRDTGALYMINVSKPDRPAIEAVLKLPGAPHEVRLDGNHAVVAAGFAGVCVVVVSGPRSPRLSGCTRLWEPRSIWAAMGVGYPAVSLDVSPGTIDVAAGGDLWVLGMSDGLIRGSPEHLAGLGDTFTAVRRQAGFLVVLSDYGVQIVEPDVQTILATVRLESAVGLEVSDQLAFVAQATPSEQRSLSVLHIAGATEVTRVGSATLTAGETPVALAVSEGHAFVAEGRDGIEIIDTSQPTEPHVVAAVVGGLSGTLIGARDNHAYVLTPAGALSVLDASDPASLEVITTSTATFAPQDVIAFTASDHHGFLAQRLSGITVFTLADLSVASSYRRDDLWINDIAYSQHQLYVLDERGDLIILDATDPTQLREVSRLSLGLPYSIGGSVIVNGDIVIVSGGEVMNRDNPNVGLRVVDASDASTPRVIGALTVRGGALRMAVKDSQLFLSSGFDGIRVIDIRDPTKPVLVTTLPLRGRVNNLLAYHEHLLASEGAGADWGGGSSSDGTAVTLFDITEPTDPKQVARGRAPGKAATLLHVLGSSHSVDDGYVLLTGGWPASIDVWRVAPAEANPCSVGACRVLLPFAYRAAATRTDRPSRPHPTNHRTIPSPACRPSDPRQQS